MYSSNKEQISINDFTKLNIVLGTILEASQNVKAKKPAYILKIDFGKTIGVKKTSAQITNYSLEELVNRQVVAVCNLPSKKIAGFNKPKISKKKTIDELVKMELDKNIKENS